VRSGKLCAKSNIKLLAVTNRAMNYEAISVVPTTCESIKATQLAKQRLSERR
jgi:hypothetical protein